MVSVYAPCCILVLPNIHSMAVLYHIQVYYINYNQQSPQARTNF